MDVVPALQAGVLLVGLAWAGATARRIAGESLPQPAANRQAAPVVVFCLGVTVAMLALLV
jgi:hypothetical protein